MPVLTNRRYQTALSGFAFPNHLLRARQACDALTDIYAHVGLVCSSGLSQSRAKVTTRFAKPGKVTWLGPWKEEIMAKKETGAGATIKRIGQATYATPLAVFLKTIENRSR